MQRTAARALTGSDQSNLESIFGALLGPGAGMGLGSGRNAGLADKHDAEYLCGGLLGKGEGVRQCVGDVRTRAMCCSRL